MTFEQNEKIVMMLNSYQGCLLNDDHRDNKAIHELSVLIETLEDEMYKKEDAVTDCTIPTAKEAVGIVEKNLEPVRIQALFNLKEKIGKAIHNAKNCSINIFLDNNETGFVADQAIELLRSLGYSAELYKGEGNSRPVIKIVW